MTRGEFLTFVRLEMESTLEGLRQSQAEYTVDDNAFDNFNRLGKQLKLDPTTILWVYLSKHFDGITNWITGRARQQREPIQGRMRDAIRYLLLLLAMTEERAT
jgi:hypothetical protein